MKNIFTDSEFEVILQHMRFLQNDIEIKNMITMLHGKGEVFLIGGAIKDICFKHKTPKDYDLVIKTNKQLNIKDFSNILEVRINSFDGYKISYKDIVFDIWTIGTHENLLDCVVEISTDGLFVNLTKSNYQAEMFNESIIKGGVKIISTNHKHPNSNRTNERIAKMGELLQTCVLQGDGNVMICDYCKEESQDSLKELGLHGSVDYYTLDLCNKCYKFLSSDYYSLERIDEIVKS